MELGRSRGSGSPVPRSPVPRTPSASGGERGRAGRSRGLTSAERRDRHGDRGRGRPRRVRGGLAAGLRGRSRCCSSRCGPASSTPAHRTGDLAELVCSNSLRSDNPENAVGLLKREMEALGSLVIAAARAAALPAGDALAVDRERVRGRVQDAVTGHPLVDGDARRGAGSLPDGPAIVATGPLTSEALHAALAALLGEGSLSFFDAIAPVVAADSLDMEPSLPRLALRQGRRRRLPQRPARPRASTWRSSRRCAPARRSPLKEFERDDPVLRGVPADRGDGRAGRRHAALRADEAGGPARPAHRPAARTRWCSCAGTTWRRRTGTWSASRPG